jgi:hypothetical protein
MGQVQTIVLHWKKVKRVFSVLWGAAQRHAVTLELGTENQMVW